MKKSKIGIALILVYLAIVVWIIIYWENCNTLLCGLDYLVAISVPWFFLFATFFWENILLTFGLSILLNIFLLYFIWKLISFLISRYVKKNWN